MLHRRSLIAHAQMTGSGYCKGAVYAAPKTIHKKAIHTDESPPDYEQVSISRFLGKVWFACSKVVKF